MHIKIEENYRIIVLEYDDLDIWAKYFKEVLEDCEIRSPEKVQLNLECSLENIASF